MREWPRTQHKQRTSDRLQIQCKCTPVLTRHNFGAPLIIYKLTHSLYLSSLFFWLIQPNTPPVYQKTTHPSPSRSSIIMPAISLLFLSFYYSFLSCVFFFSPHDFNKNIRSSRFFARFCLSHAFHFITKPLFSLSLSLSLIIISNSSFLII